MKDKPKSLMVYDHQGRAERYEQTKGFAPKRKERLLGVVLDLLVAVSPPQATLLELGAGTGHFTEKIIQTNHFSQIHVTDGAVAMLKIAQNKFSDREDLLQFDIIDFTTDWIERFATQKFDVVTSTMALHHADDKSHVFQQIFQVLKPDGVFVLADHMAGSTPIGQRLIERERALIRLGRDAQNLTDQLEEQIQLDKWRQEREGDRCESAPQYLTYLSACGFKNAECLWQDYWLAVFVACK